MKTIDKIEEYRRMVSDGQSLLLFIKTDNCSVCEGLRPQVENFEDDYRLPFYLVNASHMQELAGELLLFTAPAVILFKDGNEIQRYARFVPIDKLRFSLDALEEELDV